MPPELLFREDAYLKECPAIVTAIADRGVEVDRTVFYPAGGGQPGDTGTLVRADGTTLRIVDTRKGATPDSVVHPVDEGAPLPGHGEHVRLRLDWERRYAHMRIHTCLHVLSCVIVAPVACGCCASKGSTCSHAAGRTCATSARSGASGCCASATREGATGAWRSASPDTAGWAPLRPGAPDDGQSGSAGT